MSQSQEEAVREQLRDYIRNNVDLALSFNWTLPQHEAQVEEAVDDIMALFEAYATEARNQERQDLITLLENTKWRTTHNSWNQAQNALIEDLLSVLSMPDAQLKTKDGTQ